jgi:hypothetical protein
LRDTAQEWPVGVIRTSEVFLLFGKFTPAPGGYDYSAPNRWGFGPTDHYSATESQRADILAVATSSRWSMFWIASISVMAFAVLLGVGPMLWASRAGYQQSGLGNALVLVVMLISISMASPWMWVTSVLLIAVSLLLGVANVGDVLLWTVSFLSAYAALLFCRQFMRHRLRPILAALRSANERIEDTPGEGS